VDRADCNSSIEIPRALAAVWRLPGGGPNTSLSLFSVIFSIDEAFTKSGS
jgi:hypothetical protein